MPSFSGSSFISSGESIKAVSMDFSHMSMSNGEGHIRVMKAGSMYEGSGGFGVQISSASNTCAGGKEGGGFNQANHVCINENKKATMQNLNTRLASYLDKVDALEQTNANLEIKIFQFMEKKAMPEVHDYAAFEVAIDKIKNQIFEDTQRNVGLYLTIDNAKLAAVDFKLKYENELALRQCVEADIAGLRRVRDELTIEGSNLEMAVEKLKEELVLFQKIHTKELEDLRVQVGSQTVNVEVDAAPQEDLAEVMDDLRQHYDAVVAKNHLELECWFNAKSEEIQSAVGCCIQTIQSSRCETTEFKCKMQNLEIELQTELSLKASLEGTLVETDNRYANILSSYQMQVTSLEEHLGQIRGNLERQSLEYQMLLDIKTRLEIEISEYRRLLDGENTSSVSTTTTLRKVTTVIVESVDGKVISETETKSDTS